MNKHKPFQFKEFPIHQDQCAMKIGTDSGLLGAWTSIDNPYTILDIGAGTGTIPVEIGLICPQGLVLL